MARPVPAKVRERVRKAYDVDLRDSTWIESGIANAPVPVRAELEGIARPRSRSASVPADAVLLATRADELIRRLQSLPPGDGTWRDYEALMIEILNYLFIPPLRAPRIQSRSEDGLDRRDAIYPIDEGDRFWDFIRFECHSRSVVAEFKNYSTPPSQREVESVQQYLYEKAFRLCGLLCSRQAPSDNALAARRRAWTEADKLIIIVSDDDVIDMLTKRGTDRNPCDVLESQLDQFFLALSP